MFDDLLKFEKIISNLDKQIDKLSKSEDTDVLDHLTKYLILLMSGYIEKYLENIVKDCVCKKELPKEFKNFIISNLPDSQNLNPDKLKKFLKCFDECWGEQISQEHSTALGNIVSARNKIAHCKNINISKQDYVKHFESIKDMMQIIKLELFDKI